MNNNVNKVYTKTKCDIVVERIMSMLASGKYSTGDRFPTESELTELFSVSRVTVREAIKRLNTLGILDVRQGDGTYIRKIDIGTVVRSMLNTMVGSDLSVSEIYDARMFVEIGNVRLAARNHTEEDLLVLRDIIEKTKECLDPYDAEAFSVMDNRFHEAIGDISGNHILHSTYSTLKEILSYFIKKTNVLEDTARVSLQHHKQILEYIAQHNEYLAGITMEQHVDHAKKALLEWIRQEEAGEAAL